MVKTMEEFEKKRNWSETEIEKLVEMLEENIELIKDKVNDKHGLDKRMMNMFVLLLQIARRNGTNLENLFEERLTELREKYPVKENGSD